MLQTLDPPSVTATPDSKGLELAFQGDWIALAGDEAEKAAATILDLEPEVRNLVFDLSRLGGLDTTGAWIIDRTRARLEARGHGIRFAGANPAQAILLREAGFRVFDYPAARPPSAWLTFLSDLGRSVASTFTDVNLGVAFLGEVVSVTLRAMVNPKRYRPRALIHHMESFGFRSVPIIALISFLVGGIVAQQGIFQLQRFGATTFVVDLVGLLVFRELGVLLTAIMIAGRSGSAITAEIGSMKMREEIDAMRVMGLDPIDVLIVPRLMALAIVLPILTFVADLSAVSGAMLVCWLYGDISPEIFLGRLQYAIGLNTFLSGLIKAPFMALTIGLIASIDGLMVQGSAESLGRQVTSAVVKSIFMVIVVDGLFAMFFAAVRY